MRHAHPWHAAMAALESRVGAGASRDVRRVETREDGALVVTVEDAAGQRCFSWRADSLVELRMSEDALVPAAAALDDACRRRAARLLSWRPGRRAVVQIEARDAGQVVKAWKRGRARKAARVHELVRSSLDRDGFSVPRIQRVDEERDTVTYEVAGGTELVPADVGACARIGRGLAEFQRRVPIETLPPRTRADELTELRDMARRHRLATGSAPARFDDVLEVVASLVDGAPEPSVAAHRDLHDGQFLVSPDRIVLLDLDLCARCEPELDVANFAVHLLWCGIQGVRDADEATARLAERAFLAGVGGGCDPRALAFYRASTALRLALVFGVRPRWRDRTDRLVELATDSIAEVSGA